MVSRTADRTADKIAGAGSSSIIKTDYAIGLRPLVDKGFRTIHGGILGGGRFQGVCKSRFERSAFPVATFKLHVRRHLRYAFAKMEMTIPARIPVQRSRGIGNVSAFAGAKAISQRQL